MCKFEISLIGDFQSTHYTAEHVLKDFPTTSLLEERALILGRLGKHEQAIALYVRALNNIDKAKEYCLKVYEKGGLGSQTVSHYYGTPIVFFNVNFNTKINNILGLRLFDKDNLKPR